MRQEYLFNASVDKQEVESIVISDKIQKEIIDIENEKYWILGLDIQGEKEENAVLLDSINVELCEKYEPIVLLNGSSAYFNKVLFPIVNEFERKLRKVLYLSSAVQGDNESKNIIRDLESKDLGEIFTMLFSDGNFVKSVKEKINQKTWQFTKQELLESVNALDENTLWDRLLGDKAVKTLRNKFGEIKTYRNDVMHAHNISLVKFKAAKELFQRVNKELESTITNITADKEQSMLDGYTSFNKAMRDALLSLETKETFENLADASRKLINAMPIYTLMDSKALGEAMLRINKMSSMTLSESTRQAIETLDKIVKVQND